MDVFTTCTDVQGIATAENASRNVRRGQKSPDLDGTISSDDDDSQQVKAVWLQIVSKYTIEMTLRSNTKEP